MVSALFLFLWVIVFLALLVLILFIFWIWAIVHCISSRLDVPEKLLWLAVLVLFNVLGALLYFIFSKSEVKMAKEKSLKGRKLLRSRKNRKIAGICGGIGEYFGVDPTAIRLVWVLLVFLSFGTAIIAYIVAWIIIPEEK